VRKRLESLGWRCAYPDDSNFTDHRAMNYLRTNSPQHMHKEQLENVFRLDRFDLIFTVCRNLLTRLVSEYHYRNSIASTAGMEDWFSEQQQKYALDKSTLDNHIRPQVEFVTEHCRIFKLEDGLEALFQKYEDFLGKSFPWLSRKPLPEKKMADGPRLAAGFSASQVHPREGHKCCRGTLMPPAEKATPTFQLEREVGKFYQQDYDFLGTNFA